MATSTILRGTLLLTAATFLSKFLGMIYVIPFNALVGDVGGTLYGFAYGPYNILISLSTIGVPLAVSKFVSKYNSLGDYETGRRMFKAGTTLMAVTGVIAFLLLFFGAELLAKVYLPKDTDGIAVSDVATVIRMVSFALILIPGMSIVRGFFQGYQSMGPTAVSQVIEQIVRIIFLLVSAHVVVNVLNGTITTAVGFATFSAFIGAIASCIVLFMYWKRRKPYLDKQVRLQNKSYEIPTSDLFKELFRYAGPFVLVGIATPLYQQIDALTFARAMTAIGQTEIISTAFSNINLYGHKLVIIPVTLATGLSLAIIPALTKSFVQKDKTLMFNQINQSLQIVMLLIVPAVVGMAILSFESWGTFYGVKEQTIILNGTLLRWYAPVALFFGLFTVTSAILQGINQQRFAVISLTAGLLVKGILNIPFIHLFGAKGAIIATMLSVFTAVILNLFKIKKSIEFDFNQLIKRTMLITIFTIIMGVLVWLTKTVLSFYITYEDGRLLAALILVVCVLVGGGTYLWLSYQSTLLERILGNRVRIIDKFLNKLTFRRK
ncbi:oligosaccharide flippase family protein [Aquibacillus halophilus]|uniref:Oligosaccharide flippase family protein n=1 Tax=Aquibacillus halophilus TaxID=930132 RepID=A0A6A8DG97_9BACI|nr:polysaccharide biosynthesis protein [Aquibacillus halophilus]MRH42801.1 oligosaccharide flippase family protein [Aquibacillus halophilus]